MSVRRLVCSGVFALVVVMVPSGAALAGERIHFKNGYALDVESSRVQGSTLLIRLRDGGEIGVPQALIARVEGGRTAEQGAGSAGMADGPGARSARSVAGSNLRGVQNALKSNRGYMEMRGVALNADKVKSGERIPEPEVTIKAGGQSLTFRERPPEVAKSTVHMMDLMQQRKEQHDLLTAVASGRPLPEGQALTKDLVTIPRPEDSGTAPGGER